MSDEILPSETTMETPPIDIASTDAQTESISGTETSQFANSETANPDLELVEGSPSDFNISEDAPTEPPPNPFPENQFEDGWRPSKIMRRADWGALRPKKIESLQVPISRVAVSFTETSTCNSEEECREFVRNLQKEHLAEEGIPDIKYNFLIGGDGVIYEGRGYHRVGPIYAPSPKKIEDLSYTSINVGLIQRSMTSPPREVIRAMSFCLAKGVNDKAIEKDFYTYYIVHNEVDNILPPDRKKINN